MSGSGKFWWVTMAARAGYGLAEPAFRPPFRPHGSGRPVARTRAIGGFVHSLKLVRQKTLVILGAALAAFLLPPAAPAGAADDQAAWIARAESYLNDLTALQSRFVQVNPDGSAVEGMLYLNRPGRMRLEYDPPSPLLLVADGNNFIHVNKKLEQVSYIPLSSTAADFLLRDRLRLEGDLRVSGFSRRDGVLRLRLTDPEKDGMGSVELVFTETPFALRQWVVVDARRLATQVTLTDPRRDVPADPALFRFINPWTDRSRDRK